MNTFASGLREIPKHLVKEMTALQLFRMGFDTADIAHAKLVHEAVVLHWITKSRMEEIYQRRSSSAG